MFGSINNINPKNLIYAKSIIDSFVKPNVIQIFEKQNHLIL